MTRSICATASCTAIPFWIPPGCLDRYYRLKSEPRIVFAGQMTGVEGYVESAASGFLAGMELARRLPGHGARGFPPGDRHRGPGALRQQ